MELGFTFPLQRHVKRHKLPYGTVSALEDCWDLHCITLNGRSSLLAVHCATRYTFTLYDVTLSQWADLEATFAQGLADTCQAVGAAVPGLEPLVITRTHGRPAVAYLNRAWEAVLAMDYALDTTTQAQPLLDYGVNAVVCNCAGYPGKEAPLVRFLACQTS